MSETLAFTECPPRSIASITVFGDAETVRSIIQAEFGACPPITPGFVLGGDIILSCLAPARFLAIGPRHANLPATLGKSLEKHAAITDQSDLWFCVSLRGPASLEKLAQLVPIDVSPARFAPGALALTRAGHFNIRLWHMADQTYELAIPRSYANDLLHALS